MSSLHTTDIERAQAFYGDLFLWELARVPDAALCQWRLADQVVAVVTATDGVVVPPHWPSTSPSATPAAPPTTRRPWAVAC